MKRLSPMLFLAWLLGVAILWAGDFWLTKAPALWSAKEVERILNNSPWAKRVQVYVQMQPTVGGGGNGRGGGRGMGGGMGSGGTNGGMAGGGIPSGGETEMAPRAPAGDPAGAPAAPQQPQMNVVLRWQTALPVKHALEKSDNALKTTGEQEDYYTIAALGFPRVNRVDPERLKEGLKRQTSLNRKGKAPISPSKVEIVPGENSLTVLFLFSRSEKITLEDKEVEFVSKLGPLEIRNKFRLKDMMFGDKLEL